MPYAPGVQDISGQLLAQGMQQRAQGIAGGLVDWMKGYDQNRSLKNQGVAAFSTAIRSDPGFKKYIEDISAGNVQVPDAVVKAVKNIQEGKEDVYDASILATTSKAWQDNQNRILQQKLAEAQIGSQQAQALGHSTEAMTKLADLAWYAQQPNSGITPEMVQALQRYSMAPLGGQMPAAAPARPPTAIPAIPQANLNQQMPVQTPMPPQAVPAGIERFAQPAAISAGMPAMGAIGGGLRQQTGWDASEPWSPRNPVGVIDEDQIRQQLYPRGVPPSKQTEANAKVTAEVDKRTKMRQQALEAREVQPSTEIPSSNDGGKWLVTVDKRTGQEIGRRPNPQHPDVAAQTTLATEQAKDDSAFLRDVRKTAASATDERFANAEIRKLLRSDIKTGPLEGYKAEVKALAANLGFASPEEVKSANSFEQLEGLMMRQQLEFAQAATRGNLNTFEQQLVQRAVGNARNKLPGANEYLNDVVDAYKAKLEDRGRYESQLRKTIKDTSQLADAVRNWELDPNNSINKYFQELQPKVERVRLGGGVDGNQLLQPIATPSVQAPAATPGKLPAGWSTKR